MKTIIMILIILIWSTVSMAAEYTIPKTFQANTPAVAEEVNNNFSAAKTAIDDNNSRVEELEALVQELRDRLDELENNSVIALNGKISLDESATEATIVIEGANLQIINGLNSTESENGVGNIIMGYNETSSTQEDGDRSGSHNIILGTGNKYKSHAGLVAGSENEISGPYSTVTGGQFNTASGNFSHISGGGGNTSNLFNNATGEFSSITGGFRNEASGNQSSITGGSNHKAEGFLSSISGGTSNTASGAGASVGGGAVNEASGSNSSISGGQGGSVSGVSSSIYGGLNQTESDNFGFKP